MSDQIDDRVADEQVAWDDEEPIAPRPRGRLLRPLPLALIAVTIAAAGFLGGVLAQKGSGASGAEGLPGGGALPSFATAKAAGAGPVATEAAGDGVDLLRGDG